MNALSTDHMRAATLLAQSDAAQSLLAADNARIAAERVSLAATLVDLDKEALAHTKRVQKEQEAAFAAVKNAEAALIAAKTAMARHVGERIGRAADLNARREAAETALRATASPEIDRFAAWLGEEVSRVARLDHMCDLAVSRNFWTGATTTAATSRVGAINARLAALREALPVLDALRLEADQSDIPARLAALRSALPVIPDDPKSAAA